MRKRRFKKHRKSVDPFLIIFFPLAIVAGVFVYGNYITPPIVLGSIIALLTICLVILVFSLVRHSFRRMEQEEERRQEIFVDRLKDIPPLEFEKLVGWLFERMGYAVSFTPLTGDHGIDVFLIKDGIKAVAQVKRYQADHRVPEKEVREFYGSMGKEHAAQGFFVTSSSFTAATKQWAKSLPLRLIDGKEFVNMIAQLDKASWREILLSKTLQ